MRSFCPKRNSTFVFSQAKPQEAETYLCTVIRLDENTTHYITGWSPLWSHNFRELHPSTNTLAKLDQSWTFEKCFLESFNFDILILHTKYLKLHSLKTSDQFLIALIGSWWQNDLNFGINWKVIIKMNRFDPRAEMGTAHHMLLFGCKEPGQRETLFRWWLGIKGVVCFGRS